MPERPEDLIGAVVRVKPFMRDRLADVEITRVEYIEGAPVMVGRLPFKDTYSPGSAHEGRYRTRGVVVVAVDDAMSAPVVRRVTGSGTGARAGPHPT